jgi:TldD protein
MALGQAHLIGRQRSNGCAYADSPTAFPIQRMPNISLKPGAEEVSLSDLIAGVDRGIFISGAGSWSIDQQRDNFQFGGQVFWEIRNGALGPMLRDVAYQARTVPSGTAWTASAANPPTSCTEPLPAGRRSPCRSHPLGMAPCLRASGA